MLGVYANYASVENAVDVLKEAGFRNTDISVLFSDKTGSKHFAQDKDTRALGSQRRPGTHQFNFAGASPPPAQTEGKYESHYQAVDGFSGLRYCGGGTPAPRHTCARQPGARGHGRPDGSPDADEPTPVLAESLVHDGRSPMAAGATRLGVTPDRVTAGPGARAHFRRITRERVSAPGATRTAVLREYGVPSEAVVSRPNGRASWLSTAFAYVAGLRGSA